MPTNWFDLIKLGFLLGLGWAIALSLWGLILALLKKLG